MEKMNIEEAATYCGVPYEKILTFIKQEWIIPEGSLELLDEEDMARINLIWELKTEFGVNDESMSIILNLLDQLYRMHLEMRKYLAQ